MENVQILTSKEKISEWHIIGRLSKLRGYGSVVCQGTLATYALDPEGSQRGAMLSRCLPCILIIHST